MSKEKQMDAFITPEEKEHLQKQYPILKIEENWNHFESVCVRTGLHPSKRQVYPQGRTSKGQTRLSVEISIDGFRAIAARSGQYAGSDDAIFDNEENPKKASVTVYRMVGGQRCGFTASARMDQYRPSGGLDFMWKKMPHVMLGKCAEALALRKGFPDELSGLYTDDEMAQSGRTTPEAEPVEEKPKQTPVGKSETKAYITDEEFGNIKTALSEVTTIADLEEIKKAIAQHKYKEEQMKELVLCGKKARERVECAPEDGAPPPPESPTVLEELLAAKK